MSSSLGVSVSLSLCLSLSLSLSLSVAYSSWAQPYPQSNATAVFSTGCLLQRVERTDVQWSQIRFDGTEPRVVGSSWRSFPVWRRLANRNSNCAVMVFIRSTACDVQPKNLKRRSVAMLESGGHCPDFCIKVRLHFAAVCTTGWTKRFEYSYNK